MKKPFIVTITGPSCAGKSTLESQLVKVGFEKAISTTTRPMRAGEKNGIDYYFVNNDAFNFDKSTGYFIESVEFNGNQYGISVDEVERITQSGKPIVIVCEPGGRSQIENYCQENEIGFHPVFISAPFEVIAKRFIDRLITDVNKATRDSAFGSGVKWFNDRAKLLDTYSKRLAVMVEEEGRWIQDASWFDSDKIYTLIELDFSEETEEKVINGIFTTARGYGYFTK